MNYFFSKNIFSLFRKLMDSDWRWYGSVGRDLSKNIPADGGPKFWRGDVIFIFLIHILGFSVFFLASELNSRYWFFNENKIYVGRMVNWSYLDPQLNVQLLNSQDIVSMAFPSGDGLGFSNRMPSPHSRWIDSVDAVVKQQHACARGYLIFEGELWKFTFKPIFRIWQIRCADSEKMVVSSEKINDVWRKGQNYYLQYGGLIYFGLLMFFAILIIHRERKLYVKWSGSEHQQNIPPGPSGG
jgi:hypothetical protein